MFTITKDQLKSVAYAMSGEATRYYLNGIYVEVQPGSVILTATDGHRLANKIIKDKTITEQWNQIISKVTIDVALKAKWKTATIFKDKIICGDISLNYIPINGTYPDYKRVIPTEKYQHKIAFNRRYLMDLLKAGTEPNVVFNVIDANAPALVLTGESEDIHVIMPMRM